MIHTNKYEGHTEGPWYFDEDNELRKIWTSKDEEALQNKEHDVWKYDVLKVSKWFGNDADAQLIADAPLLLEEVKQLRLAIQNVADFPKRCPPALKLEGVIDAMVCMLREAIQ